MNPLRQTFIAVATVGSLWLSAAATPAFAAAPTTYDATGPVLEMTDTTLTIMFHGKEKWTFAKDTTTKGGDTIKVGDKVTVHYTMTAGSVDMAKGAEPVKEKGAPKKADKKAAKADAAASVTPAAKTAPDTTEAQKPAAEGGTAASPASTPGH